LLADAPSLALLLTFVTLADSAVAVSTIFLFSATLVFSSLFYAETVLSAAVLAASLDALESQPCLLSASSGSGLAAVAASRTLTAAP